MPERLETRTGHYTWRILLIDDDIEDQILIRELLAASRQHKFLLEWAQSFQAGLDALHSDEYDAVLVDYELGQQKGIDLIRAAINDGVSSPMILTTGQGNYDVDVQAMQTGAADYMNKNELNSGYLERSIRYAIERKRSQAAIQESEAHYRLLFETMLQGVVYQDAAGKIISMNPAAEKILGVRSDQFLGTTSHDAEPLTIRADGTIFPAEEHPAMVALRTGQEVSGVLMGKYNEAEGRFHWIRISAVPLFKNGEDQPHQVYTIFDDITDQRQMEERIRESEERFRIALSSVPIFVFTTDLDLRYSWVHNPLFGFSPEQIVGQRADQLFPPEYGEKCVALMNIVLETGKGVQQELTHHHNGENMYFYVTLEPVFDAPGKVCGITGATLDMTQQRRLEARQADFATQMEVQRRLMEQREMERLNIARDLHDGPLQELTAVSFGIHEAMAEDHKEKRIARLKSIQDLLTKQLHEMRAFCNELRPPTLAPFGLEKAIRSHAETFEERHPDIFVHLDLAPDGQILPESVRMAFFRIYQEALNNIVKHSKAMNVWVTLSVSENEIVLEIMDDGVGFNIPQDWIAQARGGHLGLIGMRERAIAMNARLDFESKPGRGSVIRVSTSALQTINE